MLRRPHHIISYQKRKSHVLSSLLYHGDTLKMESCFVESFRMSCKSSAGTRWIKSGCRAESLQMALDMKERNGQHYLYTDPWMVANALWGWLD